jgi:hypothetical protein
MGIGLLILVQVGKQNIYLSTQPEITFFKIAYKRHTNFSIEPTPQYFKTTPDFGRKCTVNMGRNADMVGNCYLYVQLPTIMMENYSSNAANVKKFAWVEKIGLALINYIEVEIGGTIVDRHYGDWLNIWYELTVSLDLVDGYNKMIGNYSELTSFTKTKESATLYIPLAFWFCLDSGLALPLIALLHNDVKIHVEFNDLNLCYKLSPSYYITINENFCLMEPGEHFYQMYQNNRIVGEFVHFDQINQNVYYNPIKGSFIVPTTQNDMNYTLTGVKNNYKINIVANSVVVQDNDYFQFNQPSMLSAHILTNYIYLDNYERTIFLNNTNQYIVPIVQTLPEQTVYSINAMYKIPFYNPIKMLAWRLTLQSNQVNNNKFNYTSSPYTTTEESLVTKNLIVINSTNRIDLSETDFYTKIQQYMYQYYTRQKGIYTFSFSLNPRDTQPSGSMNFSRVDDSYIQLTLNNIINYQNPVVIQAYGIQYNLFRTSHGIGGLVFNL